MSQATGRARVIARDFALRLGGLRAVAKVADISLLPRGGVVNLDSRTPPMIVHAAQIDVPVSSVRKFVRSQAAKAGIHLDVQLLGAESFTATGTMRGMPFSARGTLGVRKGKFAVTPRSVDLTDRGAVVHADLVAGKADVHVPTSTIALLLHGSGPSSPAGGHRNLVSNPQIAWTGPRSLTVSGGFQTRSGSVPIQARASFEVTPGGGLSVGVGPIHVAVPGAPTTVDLATGMATASISQSTLSQAIRSQPGWTGGQLQWLGPDRVKLTANVQVEPRFARLVGPTAQVQAEGKLSVAGGKVVATPGQLDLAGQGLAATYSPGTHVGALHLNPAALVHALNQAAGGKATVERIIWTAPDQFEATVEAAGTRLVFNGKLAPLQDGKVEIDLTDIKTLVDGQGDAAHLSLDPSANQIHAVVSGAALSRWMARRNGYGAVTLSPLGGDRMGAATWTRLLGIPLPVSLQGSVKIDAKGAAAYHIDHAAVFGIPVLGLLGRFGKTLGSLATGTWTGNTLHLKSTLPAGLKLASVRTDAGAFEADLAAPASLAHTPAGIRFDGRRLEIDPRRFLPFPGALTGLSGDASGLSVRFQLTPAQLAQQIQLPKGVAFDGSKVSLDPAIVTGQPIPGKLVAISGSAAGVQAQIALDPRVLRPLRSLPKGVSFSHDRFVIDPAAAGLPGRFVAASGGAKGLDLGITLSQTDLAHMWRSHVRGIAWNGQSLALDPSALAPGVSARAEGLRVQDGELVANVGDGTALPRLGGAPGIHVSDTGWVKVHGAYVHGLEADVTPGRRRVPFDVAHLQQQNIRVEAGRVTVPAAQVDAMIKKALTPAQYAKYQPRFVNGKIVVKASFGPFRSSVDLSFARTPDGQLELVPDGFIGALISGGRAVMTIDPAKQLGIQLAPLERVQATADGLTLTFGS